MGLRRCEMDSLQFPYSPCERSESHRSNNYCYDYCYPTYCQPQVVFLEQPVCQPEICVQPVVPCYTNYCTPSCYPTYGSKPYCSSNGCFPKNFSNMNKQMKSH